MKAIHEIKQQGQNNQKAEHVNTDVQRLHASGSLNV
jgi:hypothetical protein